MKLLVKFLKKKNTRKTLGSIRPCSKVKYILENLARLQPRHSLKTYFMAAVTDDRAGLVTMALLIAIVCNIFSISSKNRVHFLQLI